MMLHDFDRFVEYILVHADDTLTEEYYATPKAVLEDLLGDMRVKMYSADIQRQKDWAEYQRLKAIFEGESR